MAVLQLEDEDSSDFDIFYRWTTYAAGVVGVFRTPGCETSPYDEDEGLEFIARQHYCNMNQLYDMAIRIGACNYFKNALMDAFADAAWFHETISVFRPEYLAPSLRSTKVHDFYVMAMLSDLYNEGKQEEPRLTRDLEHSVVWEEMVQDFEKCKEKNPGEAEFDDRARDKLRICYESHRDEVFDYPGLSSEEFHEHETADKVCSDTCMNRRKTQHKDHGLEPNAY